MDDRVDSARRSGNQSRKKSLVPDLPNNSHPFSETTTQRSLAILSDAEKENGKGYEKKPPPPGGGHAGRGNGRAWGGWPAAAGGAGRSSVESKMV